MPSFQIMFCCLVRHSLQRTIQTTLRPGPRPYLIHRLRSNGHQSGLCAMRASNIFRLAFYIFSTGARVNSLRTPTAALLATHLKKLLFKVFLSWWRRDAYAIWWYNCLQRAEVDLSNVDDSYVRDLQTQLAETGRRLWVLDVTSDLGIPSFIAISHWVKNSHENIEFGSGAHFDSRIALLRALTEVNQFLSIGLMGGGSGEKSSLDGSTPLRLRDHTFLTPNDAPPLQLESARNSAASTPASR